MVMEQANPSRQVQEALRGLLNPCWTPARMASVKPNTWPVLDDAWKKVQSRSTFDGAWTSLTS